MRYLMMLMPVQLIRPGETFHRMCNGQLESIGTVALVTRHQKGREVHLTLDDGRVMHYRIGGHFYVIRGYEESAEPLN